MPEAEKPIYKNEFKNDGELSAANLFSDLGFKYLINNYELRNIGEIDIIYEFDEYIFLIEIKSKKDSESSIIDHWFTKWSEEKNLQFLKRELNIPINYKVIRIFWNLVNNTDIKNKSSLSHLFSQKNNVYLYKDDFDYFTNQVKLIGKITRNEFLDYIDLPKSQVSKKIDAIQFYINNRIAYNYIARVDELLQTCYIKRREGKDGYQRSLNYQKIKNISEDINANKILAFPNSIIVNSDFKLCNTNNTPDKCPCLVKIDFPVSYCCLKIIDGQHRLLGFFDVDDSIQKASYLPIIAFEQLDHKNELKMFVDINSKQKKVDPNLVLLLKNDYDWDKDDKEFYEKIAVNTILELNEKGPLKNKIYQATLREKKKGKISLYTLVMILTRNRFIGKGKTLWQNSYNDVNTPKKRMAEVINAIDIELGHIKNKEGNAFFLQNTGIRILFRFLRIIETNKIVNNYSININSLFHDINDVIIETGITDLQKSYGEGGANNSAQLLCSLLKQKYSKKYEELIIDLKKMPLNKKVK